MAMTLNKEDLQAIGTLIDDRVSLSEDRLITRIDDLDDALSIQMENGLQEVRDDIGSLREVVDRIDRVQQAEIARNDRQDADIKQIRKGLRAA